MSKNDVTASQEEQGGAGPDSVFDFLYHDSRRIGSFLSQFDNNGLLTAINQGESASRNARRGWSVELGGDVPLLAGAKVAVERAPGEGGSETFERSYDPFWTNAVAFLDILTERGMIMPQLENANLGQFVLVRGWLSILDLAVFKHAWELKTVQQAIRAGAQNNSSEVSGNRQERRAQARQQNAPRMPRDEDMTMELMTILPHTVHATIMTEYETVWANLRDEFMVTPSSEILLTHGASLPGEWAMLGVLSARPDFGAQEHQTRMAELGSALPPGVLNSAIGQLMATFSPLIRTALGRPMGAYAVTPLLIFREVS